MNAVYMLFAGDRYYPEGGTEDLVAAFHAEDDEAAIQIAEGQMVMIRHDWAYLATLTDSLDVRVVWDPECFCEASW